MKNKRYGKVDSGTIRSSRLASLFSSGLSIFGWSDLLQILRKPAAFSFAVLCTVIVYRLSSIFVAVAATGESLRRELYIVSVINLDIRFHEITREMKKSLNFALIWIITCYTVLTRPNKVETAVHGCNSWLSVWTLSCRCPIKLST